MPSYHQGFFRPKNPKKYKGDPTNICYRSSWELKFMMYLDNNSAVIEWGSEEMNIQYKDPTTLNKHTRLPMIRRYFPDFVFKALDKDNKIVTMMIEIKPKKQCIAPKPLEKGKKPTKRFVREVTEYVKNQAKWERAKEYCDDRQWQFKVLTEEDLGIKTK